MVSSLRVRMPYDIAPVQTIEGVTVCSHRTIIFFFFFQAEDGIRDLIVTGVQTCALPISVRHPGSTFKPFVYSAAVRAGHPVTEMLDDSPLNPPVLQLDSTPWQPKDDDEIGRASCRERV